MNTATSTPMPPDAAQTFDTLNEYRSLVQQIISSAQHTLVICENNLSEADIDSKRVFDALWQFFTATPTARLQLLLKDNLYLGQSCPRFAQLRERFGHLIEVRIMDDSIRNWAKGFVIADRTRYLVRQHFDYHRGECDDSPTQVAILQQQFAELWSQSHPDTGSQRLYL
jgi:hypothetical protein